MLDRVWSALGDESTDEIDMRSPDTQGGVIVHARLRCSTSADAVNSVMLSLIPLLFGAAWKILDLFVELGLNMTKPPRDNWRIDEKTVAARRGDGVQSILTDDAGIWRSVLAVYASTAEHRHCVVHRTAEFSNQPLQLSGVDRKGQLLRPLVKTELDALLVVAQAVASGVIAGGLEPRHADYLRFELDQLLNHTITPALGGKRKSKPVMVRLRPTLLADGLYELDFAVAFAKAKRVRPDLHYDVWIDFPDDSGRILFAEMEDVPKETVQFRLDAPPSFLKLR